MDDWSRHFKDLLNSDLGKEMVRELTNLHDTLVRQAQAAESAETAFGLLKEAGGVIKTLDHLNMLAVTPIDGRDKSKI